MSGNGWLARQRKSDLVDITDALGLEYVAAVFCLHLSQPLFRELLQKITTVFFRGLLFVVAFICTRIGLFVLRSCISAQLAPRCITTPTLPSPDPERVATYTGMLSWHNLTRSSCPQIRGLAKDRTGARYRRVPVRQRYEVPA